MAQQLKINGHVLISNHALSGTIAGHSKGRPKPQAARHDLGPAWKKALGVFVKLDQGRV
jgi:hypothetical protein